MAVRYTAYCRKSVAGVHPLDLLKGVQEADLVTIAECDGVADDVAEAAVACLSVVDLEPQSSFTFYRLVYRPGDVRQVDVQRWPTAEETAIDLAEVVADLDADESQRELAACVRARLEGVVDVVSASFGSGPGEAMAPVLASEATRWLAEHFDGIVRAADDTWWELGSVGEYVSIAQ